MASIQQQIQSERAKARRLRSLLAGRGEPSASRPAAGKFSDMLRQGGGARAAAEEGSVDSVDLWDVLEREAERRAAQEAMEKGEPDGEDLEELIDDAERALIGDLGNDFDDLNARWRELAAAREAKESIPRHTKKAHLLRQMARLWGDLEVNAKPSRLDDRGSEAPSHGRGRGFGLASALAPASGLGAKQPDAPFTEEDWRRLGDSVLLPPGGSGQRAAAPATPATPVALATRAAPAAPSAFASAFAPSTLASPLGWSGLRCCACGAPLVEGQACDAGARCGACVGEGSFCVRCGAALCRRGPCHGCGPSLCAGSHSPAAHACGHCACHGACCGHGACPCHGGCGACAQCAPGFVGAVGAAVGRGKPAGLAKPARRRDGKGRWLPNFPAPGVAVGMPGERGRVGTIRRGSLPSRCAVADRDRLGASARPIESSIAAGVEARAGAAFDRSAFGGVGEADRVDSGGSMDADKCGDERDGKRDGKRRSSPMAWRPICWLLALIVAALVFAAGGAVPAH